MMTMKPEELRQLRAWAIGVVLEKSNMELGGEAALDLPVGDVIWQARKLVNFVRANP